MTDTCERIDFLGCPMDSTTMAGTVEKCLEWCRADERTSHVLLTANAAILVMMQSDEELREVARWAEWSVPDGVPVVWASRLVGTPLRSRVAGVDLMAELLRVGNEQKLRVYFLGAKQEVIERLVEICAETYPELVVAGYRNGYFGEDDHEAIIGAIRDSNADILFVGMPTPFKEIGCHAHREELATPVLLGVGGSFDVLGGFVKRAPRWMQRIGMEWFWRLLMEPRKMWKRYLITNSSFIWLTFRAMCRNRLGIGRRGPPQSTAEV